MWRFWEEKSLKKLNFTAIHNPHISLNSHKKKKSTLSTQQLNRKIVETVKPQSAVGTTPQLNWTDLSHKRNDRHKQHFSSIFLYCKLQIMFYCTHKKRRENNTSILWWWRWIWSIIVIIIDLCECVLCLLTGRTESLLVIESIIGMLFALHKFCI